MAAQLPVEYVTYICLWCSVGLVSHFLYQTACVFCSVPFSSPLTMTISCLLSHSFSSCSISELEAIECDSAHEQTHSIRCTRCNVYTCVRRGHQAVLEPGTVILWWTDVPLNPWSPGEGRRFKSPNNVTHREVTREKETKVHKVKRRSTNSIYLHN